MDNLQDNNNKQAPEKVNPEITSENEKLERYKQQVEGSKKEAERLRNLALESEVKIAELDANSIIELHDKDPKMADEVAKRFWYTDYKDASASINPVSKKTSDLSEEEKFNKWYKEKRATEESEKAHTEANKILSKLDESSKGDAEKYYKMITEGKKLTVSQATEFARMATLYVNKDKIKGDKFTEWLINLWNTWLWSQSKTQKADSKSVDFWKNAFGGKFSHLYK